MFLHRVLMFLRFLVLHVGYLLRSILMGQAINHLVAIHSYTLLRRFLLLKIHALLPFLVILFYLMASIITLHHNVLLMVIPLPIALALRSQSSTMDDLDKLSTLLPSPLDPMCRWIKEPLQASLILRLLVSSFPLGQRL